MTPMPVLLEFLLQLELQLLLRRCRQCNEILHHETGCREEAICVKRSAWCEDQLRLCGILKPAGSAGIGRRNAACLLCRHWFHDRPT